MASAAYLAEHLAEVPAIVIPTIIGRHDGSGRPGLFDSVIQAAWSFCLALRARGLGTTWVTAALQDEARVKEILGIPPHLTEIVLLPVAWTKGTDFRRAPRHPARAITSFDRFGTTFRSGPGRRDAVRRRSRARRRGRRRRAAGGRVAARHRPRTRRPRSPRSSSAPSGATTSAASGRCSSGATTTRRSASGRSRASSTCATSRGRSAGARPIPTTPAPAGGSTSSRSAARPACGSRTSSGPGPSGTTAALDGQPGQGGARPAAPAARGPRQHAAHGRGPQAAGRGRPVTLRVGISAVPLGPAGVELVRQAERLGADSVWVPEFWAADALTPLAYLAGQTSTIRLGTAIVQLGARTPAMLAMSAQGLQALSGGRFVLGVGASGPQVMEGWHGVRFDRPGAAHPRDDRDRAGDHRRRTPRAPRRGLRAAAAGRRGPRDPLDDAAGAGADLRRRARAGQPAPDRRARRRLDRQLVLPGDCRGVLRPDPRGRRRGRPRPRRPRPDRRRRRRAHRRRRGGRPPTRRGLRVHVRGDGLGDHQLLRRGVRPPGLRRRRARRPAAVAGRRP